MRMELPTLRLKAAAHRRGFDLSLKMHQRVVFAGLGINRGGTAFVAEPAETVQGHVKSRGDDSGQGMRQVLGEAEIDLTDKP